MPAPYSFTLPISTTGITTGVVLDPTARVTNAMVTVPSSLNSQGTTRLQMSLDVPTGFSSFAFTWADVSTTAISSAMFHTEGFSGTTYTFVSPVSALRLVSTNFGSAAPYVLKVLQEIVG